MGKASRMSPLNEADTRAKLIDPKIKAAGWGESQIEREHYFVKGRAITRGRIYLVGEESRRREPRRVDYLLRYRRKMKLRLPTQGLSRRRPMPGCSMSRLPTPAMDAVLSSSTFS